MEGKELTCACEGGEKGVSVIGEVNIGMQDILSVGVARMERELRKKMRELREKIAEIDRNIETQTGLIEDGAAKTIPAEVVEAKKTLEETLKKLNVDKVVLDYSIAANVGNLAGKGSNSYSLKISGSNGYGRDSVTLVSGNVPFSDGQRAARKAVEELSDERTKLSEDLVTVRKKMADAPALERQMRARVVETQLGKTKDGQAILDAAMKHFTEDLDMLG